MACLRLHPFGDPFLRDCYISRLHILDLEGRYVFVCRITSRVRGFLLQREGATNMVVVVVSEDATYYEVTT